MKKFKKGILLGLVYCLMFLIVNGYLQACVALRAVINDHSLPLAIAIVVFSTVLKKAITYLLIVFWLPKLKANFSTTDSGSFLINVTLTFGNCLLITSFSDVGAIFGVSLLTSILELTSSAYLLQHTHKRVQRLQLTLQKAEEANVQCHV